MQWQYNPSLASQPYFSPCAHARIIKWAGKGKKNTSGDSCQVFVSSWNVIKLRLSHDPYLTYVKVQYVIYGNEGCGLETHTARGAAECCMGLETTARVPVSHALNDKTHIM